MIDLRNADYQAVEALTRLKDPMVSAVLRLFEAEFASTKQKLVHARGDDTIARLQGRAEAFEDLLRAVEEAPKAVKRSTP